MPYPLPKHSAREIVPHLVGTKAIIIYAASPTFWAVARIRQGCYRIQMATTLGVGHHGYVVTAKAAAEFARHTRHFATLLKHLEHLRWHDLAVELRRMC